MADTELDPLHFRILGPLDVRQGKQPVALSRGLSAGVLGTLLLEAERVVPVHRMVEALWGQEPPGTAAHQVRKAISQLRGRLPGGERLILTDSGGYRAAVGQDRIDAGLFAIRLRRSHEAEAVGLVENAVHELDRGLRLWRGRVLQGLEGTVFEAAATVLEEQRLEAIERRIELRLRLGESAGLISELRDLIGLHPLREGFRGQLMLALYRAGRQAEALEEFARVRGLLSEELGIDPGARLLALYEDVLHQRPELDPPAPVPGPGAAPAEETGSAPAADPPDPLAACPCTLPYDIRDFTGREEELARILALGRDSTRDGTRIIAIDGMGGSGKTTLAVHAAHRLAEQCPDGQLHIDLRGHTPGEEPLDTATALEVALRTVGMPSESIPEGVAGRTALWRTTTARRRLLLVLDNATDVEPVRALIPASAGCLVLVTSRSRLVGLSGASWLTLDALSETAGTELITECLGAERADAEPEAVTDLVRLCSGLPLALRIAAARLGRRPRWSVRHMADLLRDEGRLRELQVGEHSVAAALTLSYRAMSEEYRTAFRLLGAHPGTNMSPDSVAALLDTGVDEAREMLETLLDVQLLQQQRANEYSFHDLVRSFALQLSAEQDGGVAAGTAFERLARYYAAAAERACDRMFPGRARYAMDSPSAQDLVLPDFAANAADGKEYADDGEARALNWFRAEHQALVASVGLCRSRGLHRLAAVLARSCSFYLHGQGYFDDFVAVGVIAVGSARELEDPLLLSVSLTNLAMAYWQRDRFRDGIDCLDEALTLSPKLGDRRVEAAALSRLGLLRSSLGHFTEALTDFERSLDAHRELGSEREQAEVLANICAVSTCLGRVDAAVAAGREAVRISRAVRDRATEITALIELSRALELEAGDGAAGLPGRGEPPAEAVRSLERAAGLCEELHAPAKTIALRLRQAEVHLLAGRPAEALLCASQALDLTHRHNIRTRQVAAENLLGSVHLVRGDLDAALVCHVRAHQIAAGIDLRYEDAFALAGMAAALRAVGDDLGGRQHLAAAQALFDAMAVPPSLRPGPVGDRPIG